MRRDIAIIGGGPGGYVAAIRAAQLGASVTLIEKADLGGTCLNWGCIPTKALYQNANVIKTISRSEEFGVTHEGFAVHMDKIQERKDQVVTKLRDGIAQLIKSYGVEYVEGLASFVDAKRISVKPSEGDSFEIEAENFIIATGSVPAMLNIPGIDLPGVMNSDHLLAIEDIPASMVVVGGGVIGLEFASIFATFGTEVTVVEYLPRILSMVDKDLVVRLSASLRKDGIKFATDMRVQEITQGEDGLLNVIAEGKRGQETFSAEKVLMATGRNINVEGLKIDAIGVEYDRKGIKVDDKFATNVKGIYAIGDVIGGYMLAHVASDEGKACVETIMGLKGHINYDCIPSVVFTSPEVAMVGITEDEAKEQGIEYSVGRFMMGANSKAVTMGEELGMVKVIAREPDKVLIGAHVLGVHAGTLIHEAAVAIEHKLTVQDIAHTVHAHPTISEAFLEAVLAVEGRAIHAAPPRRK